MRLFGSPLRIINKINSMIYDKRVNQVHANHRRNHSKNYRPYDEIIEKFRGTGGLKHDFQSYKLFSLAEILEAEKPKSILELGTGSSTAVFAKYIWSHEDTQLISVDESDKWLENSRKLAEIPEEDPKVKLIHASKKIVPNTNPVEIKYDHSFEQDFDLVFIDGPSLEIDSQKRKDAVNSNIFEIVKRKAPKLILVDIREATVNSIIEKLSDQYQVYKSDIITRNIRDNYRYFSIFKLKPSH